MSPEIGLFSADQNYAIKQPLLNRIAAGIVRKQNFTSNIALFVPPEAPRIQILNQCREHIQSIDNNSDTRKSFWIAPFRCWDMLTIGNLSIALLWHIYRNFPDAVLRDEKTMYALGKISVALPVLADGIHKMGPGYNYDQKRPAAIVKSMLPPDRKSSISSLFSACEQIAELSEAFERFGHRIGEILKVDTIVIPIIDIDLCLPEQAVSLLFAIRNFICCDLFTTVIITEKDILTNYIATVYGNSLTAAQSFTIVQTLFDDWVTIPPSSLLTILQSIDSKLTTREIESISQTLMQSGVLHRFEHVSQFNYAINRHKLFINNTLTSSKHSVEEFRLSLLLFLFGALSPDVYHQLATSPYLEQYIALVLEPSTKTVPSKLHQGAAAKKGFIIPVEILQMFMASQGGTLFTALISALPRSTSTKQIAQWITTIAPFI